MTKIPALLRSCYPDTGGSSSMVSVAINIAGAEDKHPKVFTTSDKIEGVVTITVAEKTAFGDIKITFEGISRVMTWGGINGLPLISARQTFMKFYYPIEKSPYQPGSILEPGWCYKFPFTFIVPENLPLTPCNHQVDDTVIANPHTKVPPSICKETDTECFSIDYIVRVVISRPFYPKDQPTKSLVNAVRPVKILPSGTIGGSSGVAINTLTSHKELKIRRGWRGKCTGRLAVLASPAGCIRYPFHQIDATDQANTSIKLDLVYNPVRTGAPPRLRKVYPRLNLVTSFHATPRNGYPSFGQSKSTNLPQGNHVQSLTLPTVDIESAQWVKVTTPSTGVSSSRQGCLPTFTDDEILYRTSIVVPISVPKHDDLVPSFQSCFISRMYTLEFIFSYCMTKEAGSRTVKIEVPVDITLRTE
ncbi:hypothetical protein BDV38DRAFT_278560 [Aspergillus pseudotamarii]|uniref:Arrestin-like N-terminal domain-containing protein n=1 Tax=Aspergillus pseudotamarii TaxID=132259 RepID=A0A5N6T631_ASPPS|nr:uncharacterized protein BDV38DRAFT_278560 [Aspergillus pseudotamarii]KAE8141776.1 hypothetical protein BDV38DRAFT_278560 [Aspergillus pseudotamarii]